MKKQLLLCLAILWTSTSYAQKYHPGKLVFTDGKTIEGLVKPPRKYNTSTIVYKVSEASEKVSYKSNDLKSVIILGAEQAFELERGSTFDPIFFTVRKSKPQWMVVQVKGPATLYVVGQKLRFKKGNLSIYNQGSIPYYAKRDGEEAATLLCFYSPATIGLDKAFRKYASDYFSDYPALVKRIQDKEFKLDDVAIVVNEYNKWKGDKLAAKPKAGK